jgi:hypothetical protein
MLEDMMEAMPQVIEAAHNVWATLMEAEAHLEVVTSTWDLITVLYTQITAAEIKSLGEFVDFQEVFPGVEAQEHGIVVVAPYVLAAETAHQA